MKTLRNLGYFNLLAGLPIGFFMYATALPLMIPAGLLMLILAWCYRDAPFIGQDGQLLLGLAPLPICVALTVGLYIYSDRPFRQTVLVPAGYRGVVVIGYGVADGQPEQWDEDGRLIRLSSQGIAATQFAYGEGSISPENDKFYEIMPNGQRRSLLSFRTQFSRKKPDTVGVAYQYLYGGVNTLVCVIARADSMDYYLQPVSGLLRPTYARQVDSVAAALGVADYSPNAYSPDSIR